VHPAFVISAAARRPPLREPQSLAGVDDSARAEPRLGEIDQIAAGRSEASQAHSQHTIGETTQVPLRGRTAATHSLGRSLGDRPQFDVSPENRKAPRFAGNDVSKNESASSGIFDNAAEDHGAEEYVASRASTAGAGLYIEPRIVRPAPESARVAEFMTEEAGPLGAWIRLFWSVLIVAGLGLLLAQLVYVYRAQIAIQIPALRPVLEQACGHLNCSVAYSRHIDQISIMSSSLKAIPKASAVKPGAAKPADAGAAESGSMTLQLTLRNNFNKPQEWPNLVLDLTDFSGALVVRKNLAPADYLTSDVLQQPFAPGSEVVATVPIALHGPQINGYQLSKYFP
jgi:hypothetical protein